MKKLIATILFSSVLSIPVVAAPSASSNCLKDAMQTIRTDLGICKDLKGKEKDVCRKAASKKFNESRAICKALPKAPVKDSIAN